MNTHEEQREEIETIRERSLKLNLSDADVKRITGAAGRVGLTVAELLENFIGDLVDGTYTNGSDERMYANQWLERCWFGMDSIYGNSTLLRFLLGYNGYDVEDVISYWQDVNDYENSDDEDCRELYREAKEVLDEMYSDFLGQLRDVVEKPTLEASMKEVMKWWDERQLLDYGERYMVMENVPGSSVPVKVSGKHGIVVQTCFSKMGVECYRADIEGLEVWYEGVGFTGTLAEFFSTSEDELKCESLYLTVQSDEDRRVFGFNGAPDWNKMLSYYFGDVMTSSGKKQKYFIVDTSEKRDNDER